jgi:hypothetical protein
MSDIVGGGVANVGKPVEHYKIIDQRRADSVKTGSDLSVSQTGKPNNFSKVLDANRVGSSKKLDLKSGVYSRVDRAKAALEAQTAKSKASLKPTQADMDSMINASGLTSDQVSQLLGSGVGNNSLEVKAPLNPNDGKVGTNLALKKLAKEMEVQIMGMFFTLMDNAREVDPEGGFGEKLFRGQYLTEVVKGSADEELGEIGLAIYRNLVQDDNIKKVRDVK